MTKPFTYKLPISGPKSALRLLVGAGLGSACLLVEVLAGEQAFAAPNQGQVVAGGANISQAGSSTIIRQETQSAIINWQQFSIGAAESVQFFQPNSDAAILNRVTGSERSEIFGSLIANGNVFLINPNGILFGESAHVDVGGFIASTFDITNENFLSGNYLFDIPGQPGAGIENLGKISVAENGLAAFVAPHVSNHGIISAHLGRVALGATDSGFALDLYGDELIRFAVSEEMAQRLSLQSEHLFGINNQGRISADGGTIALTASAAREVVSDIITAGGELRATGVGTEGGAIVLFGEGGGVNVTSDALVDVSNESGNGGEIRVAGDHVYLDGELRASSSNVGGTVDVKSGWLSVGGTVDASGGVGGSVSIQAEGMSNTGSISVSGFQGQGGRIDLAVDGRIDEFEMASLTADGRQQGGDIRVVAGEQITSSASYSASSLEGDGGRIDVTASVVKGLSASYSATGGGQGGSIRLGGEFQGGKHLDIDELPNAQITILSSGSVLDVSGRDDRGGEAILWSDETTIFNGSLYGEGAFAEISSAGTISFAGAVNIGSGELLLDPKNIIISNEDRPNELQLILGYDHNYDESNLGAGDNYGAAVALDGTHLAVGAPGDDGSGDAATDTGAVYLYTFASTDLESPTLSAVIGSGYTGGNNVNQSLDNGDALGSSVALDGTHLAVGVTGDDGSAGLRTDAGAVYLYSFTGDFSTITQEATIGYGYSGGSNIDIANLQLNDFLGGAVALDGGNLALGATGDDSLGSTLNPDHGVVYLLTYTGDFDTITQRRLIGNYFAGTADGFTYQPITLENNDRFGSSLALDGSLLAIGANGDDGYLNGVSDSGSAYLFSFTANFASATQQAVIGADYNPAVTFRPNDIDNTSLAVSDSFGSGIALDGTNLVVGATGADIVYRYTFTGSFTSITAAGTIGPGGGVDTSSVVSAGDNFGSALALDGNFIVIGADEDDGFDNPGTVNGSGAVHIIDTSHVSFDQSWNFADFTGATSVVHVADLESLLDAGTAVTLQASNDITVENAVAANNGGGAGGNLTLQAGRSILVNADITTDDGNLTLEANETAADGVVDADRDAGAANITMAGGTTINTGAGTATFTLSNGAGNTNTTVGTIALNNVTAGGLVINNANSGSSVTDTGTLSVAGTTDINASGATVTLDSAANDFDNDDSGDALTVDGATVKVVDTDALNVGTSGVTTLIAESGANLTLSGTVTASGDLGDGNDTAIVLASGANFIEGASGDLNPGAGRFIVYSANPGSNTLVDLTATPWYNTTYNSGSPTAVSGTGDRFAYTQAATLTVTAENKNRDYGDANPALTQTVTGYVNSETAAIVTGALGAASTAATSASSVAGSPYTITANAGTLGTDRNYTINTANGSLTVDERDITLTADDQTITYGANATVGASGDFSLTSGSLAAGETITAVTLTSDGNYGATLAGAGTYTDDINVTGVSTSGGGFNAANYNITFVDGDLTVNQRAITVKADDQTITYGANATVGVTTDFSITSGSLVGAESIDDVTITSAGGYNGTLADAGTYTDDIELGGINSSSGGFNAANYSITLDDGDLIVNQRAITVKADDQNITYGANATVGASADFSITAGSLVGGETITAVTLDSAGGYDATLANAGTVTDDIEVTGISTSGGGFDTDNYAITFDDGDLIVNQAALEVTANDRTRFYGNSLTLGSSAFTPTGLVGGETIGSVTLSSANSYATTTTTNVGTYVDEVEVSAATGGTFTASNYSITYTPGDLTISPASLIIRPDNRNKDYGDNLALGTTAFSSLGLHNSETIGAVTITSANGYAGNTSTNAGTYSGELVGSGATGGTFTASNYNITYWNANLTIDQVALSVTANNDAFAYDGTSYSGGNGVVYAGFVNTETSAVLGGALTYGGSSQGATNANTYAITPGGLTSTNYAITFVPGTLTINPVALSITADNQSRDYGDTLAVSTAFTTVGLVGAETIGSVTVTGANTSNPAAAVGFYANDIVPSNATGGTFLASNYTITYNNGDLTIDPRALSIIANSQSKSFGSTLVIGASDYTAPNLANGETIGSVTLNSTGSYDSNPNAAIGTYAGDITIAGAAGGTFNPANYTITYVPGTFTVTAATLTITANSESFVYNGSAYFGGAGVTYSGFVGADTPASLGGALAYTGDSQGAINAGSYSITPSGLTHASYDIVYVGSTLTITQADLVITADDQSRVYGDVLETASSNFTSVGLVVGDSIDTVAVNSLRGADASTAVGNYADDILISDAQGSSFLASNYNITYNPGSLEITPRPIVITLDDQSKTYGDSYTLDNTAFTVDDMANGETIGTVTLASADDLAGSASASAGLYVDDLIASDANGGTFIPSNYDISYVAADFTIDLRDITLVATPVEKEEGEEDPLLAVDISAGSLGAADSLEDVFGSLSREEGEEPGFYDVLIGTGADSGAKVSNYNLGFNVDNNAFSIVAPRNYEELEKDWASDPVSDEEIEYVLPPLDSEPSLPETGGQLEIGDGGAMDVSPPEYSDGGSVVVVIPEPPAPKPPAPAAKPAAPKPAAKAKPKAPKPIVVTAEIVFVDDGTVTLELSNGSTIKGITLDGLSFSELGEGLSVRRQRSSSSTPPGLATTLTVAGLSKGIATLKARYLLLDEEQNLMFLPFNAGSKDVALPGEEVDRMAFAAMDVDGADIEFEVVQVRGGIIVKPKSQVSRWLMQAGPKVVTAMALVEIQKQLDVHVDNIVTVYLAR
ncbi:MAG: filamentous hemagglutinin N-terminal domain-containing protein [Cellvibrionaceae bacterium]